MIDFEFDFERGCWTRCVLNGHILVSQLELYGIRLLSSRVKFDILVFGWDARYSRTAVKYPVPGTCTGARYPGTRVPFWSVPGTWYWNQVSVPGTGYLSQLPGTGTVEVKEWGLRITTPHLGVS